MADDDTPTPDQVDDSADSGSSDDQQQKPAKTYTKAEVDAMTKKAATAARKEYGDYLDLKAKAEEYDKLQESTKSNEVRLQERADRAVRERDVALTRATNTMVRSAIITVASRLGSVDPEAVAALLPHDDLVVEGDEVLGVEEAVKSLLAKKPYLRSSGASRAGAEMGANGQEPALITRSQIQQWARSGQLTKERQQQIEEANAAGRIVANR